MASAFATANLGAGILPAAITITGGPADGTRAFLNDGNMDGQYIFSAGFTWAVTFDFGAPVTIQGVGVLNHNFDELTGVASIGFGIEAADNAGFSVNYIAPKALSVGDVSHKDWVIQWAAGISRRYWRVDLGGVSGSGVLRLGELFFYNAPTVFTRGQQDGSGEAEDMINVAQPMLYGSTRVAFFGGPVREKSVVLADLTPAELAQWQTLHRATKGGANPFLWIEEYVATSTAAAISEQDCVYGRLNLPSLGWKWTSYNRKQPPTFIIRSEGREVGS